jgi:hypothetical protein
VFILTSCSYDLHPKTANAAVFTADASLWESLRVLKTVPFTIVEQISSVMARGVHDIIK